jgi:hypothetical protein
VSRLSRATAVIIVVVFALSAASMAFGSFTKGVYRTKPPANRTKFLDFSFTATKTKATTVRYSYRATSACSNGTSAIGTEEDYSIPAATIRKQTGTFSINVTDSAGNKLNISGKVKGRKASGSFRSRFAAGGGVTCDTKTLHWTALHLG